MNREQAWHILDAYIALKKNHNNETEAIGALREVILDAMTEYKAITYSGITYPRVTSPADNKPFGTCTGVDPSHSTITRVVGE